MVRSVVAIGLVALWAISLEVTYKLTRTKWHALGAESGRIAGRAKALDMLCGMATPGALHDDADARLGVKTSEVTIKKSGPLAEIRCQR